jgi:hypothetical protein
MSDYEPKHDEVQPLMSDRLYNRLKDLNTKVIPAAGALYFALAKIWGFPKGEEVVGTLAVVATFITVLLVWANSRYEKSGAGIDGTVEVQHIEGQKTVVLDITTLPEDMINQKQVNLKVNNS